MKKLRSSVFVLSILIVSAVFAACENPAVRSVTHAISYDRNGGIGSMSSQSMAEGATETLTANAFTRDGYAFAGWGKSKDATTADYADKASFTMGSVDVTLFAMWESLYKVGDTGPAGGLIFYVNPNAAADGWSFLEAAPADLADRRYWGTYNNIVAGADGTAIGSGKQNTRDIVAGDTSFVIKAADVCSDYSVTRDGKTFDDWFLPSKDELHLMYLNLASQNVGGFDLNGSTGRYWSSTEYSSYNACLEYFSSGSQQNNAKHGTDCHVRPVRAF